jgi:hypothetical protein
MDINLNLLEPLAQRLMRRINLENADAFTFAVFGPIQRRSLINTEIVSALKQMEINGVRGTLDLYNKIYT